MKVNKENLEIIKQFMDDLKEFMDNRLSKMCVEKFQFPYGSNHLTGGIIYISDDYIYSYDLDKYDGTYLYGSKFPVKLLNEELFNKFLIKEKEKKKNLELEIERNLRERELAELKRLQEKYKGEIDD